MLAITSGAFDRIAFMTQARCLTALVDEFETLGLDTAAAAAWASEGFTAGEARVWIDFGFTPERASVHADHFCDPAAAAHDDANRDRPNWFGYCCD